MSNNEENDKERGQEDDIGENFEKLAINDDLLLKIDSKPDTFNDKSEAKSPTKKKSVGFAALPEEDLTQHHKDIKKKQAIRAESNPFHKIPPELAYLQKKSIPMPKPIIENSNVTKRRVSNSQIGDLTHMPIKVISIQNHYTEINFDYPSIELPIPAKHVLVNVKYSGLNSHDLLKIYQFGLNISNRKIGLGYEFFGIVDDSNHPQFAIGDQVVGLVDPKSKQGSLSTSLLLNPSTACLLKVNEDDLSKLNNIDINLCFDAKSNDHNEFEIVSSSESDLDSALETQAQIVSKTKVAQSKSNKMKVSNYEISDNLSNIGKLVTFPLLFCRSKQILAHLNPSKLGTTNILINGADTNLGYTLIQTICANYDNINLILIVREESIDKINNMIQHLQYDPSFKKIVNVISFDSSLSELQIPGRRIATEFKKLDFFATEVLEALFSSRLPGDQLVDHKNLTKYQLDMFIDIVGSKKMFQKHINFDKIDEVKFPFLNNLAESTYSLFHGQLDEAFFAKLLKPKSYGSAFVSVCKFETKSPSYAIKDLYEQQSVWNKLWGSTFISYNWYEEINLQIKQEWLESGLQMMINNRLKFEIDHIIDWRNKNTKTYIQQLKDEDKKLVLKVEDY